MSNPRFARPQHQPRGGMHDFTHYVLPTVFFLHFIITGTVVLVYTLYLHEPIPEKYAIGASITFGCVLVPMTMGYIILRERKRYGRNRTSDEEMTFSPPQSRSKSRTRKGMKEHWLRWRTFCQEYGNQQRKYVREFVGKRKERSALRETTVNGANRIQSLNNTQIFTFVLEKWTRNLAQSRMKNLGDSTAQQPSRSTDKASSDKQKQSELSQAIGDARAIARKRRINEDPNPHERPRVISHDFHGRTQEAVTPRRFSFGSDFASNPPLNSSETGLPIESYRNPTVEHSNKPNARRPSVAPEDVLPKHPEPNELYAGRRHHQISQTHSATTRGRSVSRVHENEGHTAGPRGGRGGSLPLLRRRIQADDRQASFELQNTCLWTTNDPFSKQHTVLTQSIGTFNNLIAGTREAQMTTLPAIVHLSRDSRDTEGSGLSSNAKGGQHIGATRHTRLRNESPSNQSSRFSNSSDNQTFRLYKAYSVDAVSLKPSFELSKEHDDRLAP